MDSLPFKCICGHDRYKTRKRATINEYFDANHKHYATVTLETHPGVVFPTCHCAKCNRDVTGRVKGARDGIILVKKRRGRPPKKEKV